MKIHYLQSASVIIEANSVKVLCDPWLVDGEYYGSWNHYPPYNFDSQKFDDIDFIYISHIHPDHFSFLTLEKLNKNIPILIHEFQTPFLKNNILRLGFEVLELPHNTRTHLKRGVYINILAADDCNPEICNKFFGCGIFKHDENTTGSVQIDSISVIDDGSFTVVNVNDSPIALTKMVVEKLKQNYAKIDFLLVGYAGAGPFPQCFPDFSNAKKLKMAEKKKKQFLNQGIAYVKTLKPKFYMPFAGTYILGGSLAKLNKYRGVPELEEALSYFTASCPDNKGILLNSNTYFDLKEEKSYEKYIPLEIKAREHYIKDVLSKRRLSFEEIENPTLDFLKPLLIASYQRMERVRKSLGFSTNTEVIVPLISNHCALVSMNGDGLAIRKEDQIPNNNFVRLKVDPKLLWLILKGPKYAHWQNAEIGSHIQYSREPEIFERSLYYCMNFFHS